jgi:hypothetical protein
MVMMTISLIPRLTGACTVSQADWQCQTESGNVPKAFYSNSRYTGSGSYVPSQQRRPPSPSENLLIVQQTPGGVRGGFAELLELQSQHCASFRGVKQHRVHHVGPGGGSAFRKSGEHWVRGRSVVDCVNNPLVGVRA